MKWFLISICALVCTGLANAQSPATPPAATLDDGQVMARPIPPEVVNSAVTAVEKLGEQVVLGRYQTAIERMNPLWKDRMAKRLGSMAKLDAELNEAAAKMVRQGITMISFKTQGVPRAFEVWPGTETVKTAAGPRSRLVYEKWMVLVPTVTRYRITPQGGPKPIIIESAGFQVAVRAKDSTEWTFIDGSNLSGGDLRSLFVTLPQDIELPAVERKQVQ
ncbi:MAG: hypothetical protein V4733_05675 [Verrucomicrobiota bacterium]